MREGRRDGNAGEGTASWLYQLLPQSANGFCRTCFSSVVFLAGPLASIGKAI